MAAPPTSQPRWGAHRLERRWAERVVAASGVGADDLVLDLGAGTGALSIPLAHRGARVIAVELHPGRARGLRARTLDIPALTVVEDDILSVPLPRRSFRVVANPPYAVATAVVRRLTARGTSLRRADLVLPRWAVRRHVASPPQGFDAQMGMHVPASAFRPSPRSGSAVLVLRRRSVGRGRRR